MHIRNYWMVVVLVGASVVSSAQWLNQPAPKTPRTKDGKPILSAPAPRAPNGKPDLSGVWEVESSPLKEIEHMMLPGGENGCLFLLRHDEHDGYDGSVKAVSD